MFDKLIEIALKSALENPEIKERIKERINEVRKTKNNQIRGEIIDMNKNNFKVVG